MIEAFLGPFKTAAFIVGVLVLIVVVGFILKALGPHQVAGIVHTLKAAVSGIWGAIVAIIQAFFPNFKG